MLERFGIPPLEEGFGIEIDPNASNAEELAWAHAIGAAVMRFGLDGALKPLVEALQAAGRAPDDPADAAIIRRIDQVIHRQYVLGWHAATVLELTSELTGGGGERGLRLAKQRYSALYANLPLKPDLADSELRRLAWAAICPKAGPEIDKPPRPDISSLLFLCALKYAGDAQARTSILAAMSTASLLSMAPAKPVDSADLRGEITTALALKERRMKAEADFLAAARAQQDCLRAPQFG